jgi:hypothetical protein
MSEAVHPSPLHAYVRTRFREAFGQPSNTLQQDDHWALQTLLIDKPINVLVNGTPKSPAVWVFDPHELINQVFSTALADETQVDDVITLIQGRVRRAGRSTDQSASITTPSMDADSSREAFA